MNNRLLLWLSYLVIFIELGLVALNYQSLAAWLSHNLWVVAIPFVKLIFKNMLAIKLWVFIKSLSGLFSHLFKLLLLKLFKTLGLRYGIFFSQSRWRWMRKAKVMFLRRGKQFFRKLSRFWGKYQRREKGVIMLAFFPAVLLLLVLGLSFNLTRKTMVEKTQEAAIFKAATQAGENSSGIRAWIAGLDELTLKRIRKITEKHKEQK